MRIEYSVVKEQWITYRLGDNFYHITIAYNMQVISGAKSIGGGEEAISNGYSERWVSAEMLINTQGRF